MKKISILFLVVVAALSACKKTPEVNLKYVDVERDLITVGTTTATVQCDYQYIATLKKAYLYYGEGEDEADMNTAEMRVVQNTLYVDLAGLRENTTYSYYYEFVNGFNSMRSAAKTFKTEASPVTPPEITLPTVVTAMVTEITANSAKGGGEVTNDGGAEVTERGICWSINENPTLNNSHITAGSGTGVYTAVMNGLENNTTYHVRAYAINEKGTAYGLDREFVTIGGGGSGVPEGAIDGLFSVSPTKKVFFSQGNLQYQASTNTWKFAEHQWNYVGGQNAGNVYENGVKCDNELVSSTYNGWIDLFGWGTSGYNHGAVCYQPWSISENDSDYYAYGQLSYCLNDQTGQADWGYNCISNGGNQEHLWRTLSEQEWVYVFRSRLTLNNVHYVKAKVNDVIGVVLLPDNWDTTVFHLADYDYYTEEILNNIISFVDWTDILEPAGAVFFPASGERIGSECMGVTFDGTYWGSSYRMDDFLASTLHFAYVLSPDFHNYRRNASAVRLVQDATPLLVELPTVVTTKVSEISVTSVVCDGEVTNNGGAEVTECGFCWSVNENPTLDDGHVAVSSGTVSFTSTINDLTANTTYYICAYATNEAGTAYSLVSEFITHSGGDGVPIGAINGLFTINENGGQVYFSQGNLQYQASTNTWRFAENQYDCIGNDNSNISPTNNGWIDLFGWGTSGWDCGNTYYHPWDSNNSYGSSYGPPCLCNLTGNYSYSDWGYYNAISNGGNECHQWRTMTRRQWIYVFDGRITVSGLRYAMAKVNNVNGVILLPDDWSTSYYTLNNANYYEAGFDSNVISSAQWITLEEHGAVFLPAAGSRDGTSFIDDYGRYQSASCITINLASHVSFHDGHLTANDYSNRYFGYSVRLVRSVQ